jgi:geranylgeranyl diphosphate synthase type II
MRTEAPAAPPARAEVESRLAEYRELVRPVLERAVPEREPRRHLYDVVRGHLSRMGKGLRPALCIATCRAFGGRADDALPSAAALELLHNAFLVHDDVEDESEFRRGQPTIHQQYGVPVAVNAGDAMQALALHVMKDNLSLLGPEKTWAIFDEFDHMMIETIEGQAMELGWIRDNDCDTTEEDYLLLVLKKTCWYSFIHPCRVGAIASGEGARDLEPFNRFGYYLGTAFQIQDDVLNLVGERNRYGKEIGGDLFEGKRTLILVHLFKSSNQEEKEKLRAFLAKPRQKRTAREVAWIYELLDRRGSIEYARRVSREFLHRARTEFETAYAAAPPGDDRRFLEQLLDYVVARNA